jgi:hypothetical protein
VEGWRFNPPRSWPVEPGYEPERGWRPPAAWGPLPPGHQLWLPEHPQSRRRLPSVLALVAVSGLVAGAVGIPASMGVSSGTKGQSVVWRAAAQVSPVAEATTPEAGRTPSPIKKGSAKHAVRRFATCAELRQVYPHGVGLRTAHDRTAGTEVTGFDRDARVYAANKARDGDGDGIACERP